MAKGRRRAGRGAPATPVTQTLGPARRASRPAVRERRPRRRRRRLSVAAIAGVVAVVVAVLALGGVVVAHKTHTAKPKERTQRTVLLSVTGSDGSGRAVTLLAYDPGPRRASMVLIPPHTLAD